MIAALKFAWILVSFFTTSFAFAPTFRPSGSLISSSKVTRSLELYAAKKKVAAPAVDANGKEFWQGDWVCADCGYVYDIDFDGGGLFFEQQTRGFICPQCSAPRKRYAKKVGDKWGVTNDGGDFPIYFLTFGGLVATIWFSLVVVPTL